MTFAPESPWWLVRHGKLAEAERSARRLGSVESAQHAPDQVANMVRVTKLEQEETKAIGNASWLELFKGTDLRRTEITCVAWIGGLPAHMHRRVSKNGLLTRGISAKRLRCHFCRIDDLRFRAGRFSPGPGLQSRPGRYSHPLRHQLC